MSDDQASWLSKMGDILGINTTDAAAASVAASDPPAEDAGTGEGSPSPAASESSTDDVPSTTATESEGSASPPRATAESEEESGSWWDKATEAVEDAYDRLTGEDEESEGEENQGEDSGASEDDSEDESGDTDSSDGAESEEEEEVTAGFNPTAFTLSVEVVCANTEEVTLTVAPREAIEGFTPQTQTRPGTGEGKSLPTAAFGNLPEGEYAVSVQQGTVSQIATVKSPTGPSSLKFDLVTNTLSTSLTVNVVCAGDEEVSVTVAARDGSGAPQSQTQAGAGDGKTAPAFEFANLSEGEYSVHAVQGNANQMATVKYPGGPSRLKINLSSNELPDEEVGESGLNIVLVWATNKKPVGGATINLLSMSTATPACVTTDGNGIAVASGLAPELWVVQSITKETKSYVAAGAVDLADGGFKPMNLVIVPQDEGEDEETYDDGPLPTISKAIPIQVNKEFSYFTVSTVTITATFKPTKALEGVTNNEFDAKLKGELNAKLTKDVELGGSGSISTSGLDGSLSVKGKIVEGASFDADWTVDVNVFKVERHDPSKSQSGEKFGPLVVTPPTIAPKVALSSKEITLAGVPGKLSVTVSVAVSPNYEKIAIEVGEKIGIKVVAGLGKTAMNIISNGIYTLYINYKHIIGGLNPDHYKAQAESVARMAENAFKTGVTGGAASFSSPVSTDAYNQGKQTRMTIFNKLKSDGAIDVHNANTVLDQAVSEAIAGGAFDGLSAKYQAAGKLAAWQKFMADEPDAMDNNKMAVAAALWGRWNSEKIPPQVRKTYD